MKTYGQVHGKKYTNQQAVYVPHESKEKTIQNVEFVLDHATSCDLAGQQFGCLIALYKLDRPGKAMWHCRCNCGNECDVSAESLKRGHTKSCGCKAKKKVKCVETGKNYSSITEAAINVGLKTPASISKQLHGKLATAGGYHWEYV